MKKLIIAFVSVFFIGLIAGCGGGANEDLRSTISPVPAATVGQISGKILDGKTGQPAGGLTVSAGTQNTTTASDGSFTLSNIDFAERLIVTIAGNGFAEQSRIIRLISGTARARLSASILPISSSQTFDPSIDKSLVDPGSAALVSITAGSLVRVDGTPPVGNVTMDLTVIDPTIDITLMPGDMQADIGNGNLAPIESFGAITVVFKDSEAAELNLAAGATATIRIPLADKSGAPPANIPLYFYDKVKAVWLKEGNATLVTSDPANKYYEGSVSHFSTWNADVLYPQINITGCVEDSNGNRVTGVKVIAEGNDYAGFVQAYTNATGDFVIAAKPESSVLIVGLQLGSKTNTVKLQTTSAEQTMASCLVLSNVGVSGQTSISIKLTWGIAPLDLDSHLVGSSGTGVAINFLNKGNLASFPFAQLDVDDITSFGPEVITIFKFNTEGTYRYSVNNYSETFSPGMTGSPSRVELNLSGDVSVFTPPAGEGANITWNVFDFVVTADGTISVNTINTWSATSPLTLP